MPVSPRDTCQKTRTCFRFALASILVALALPSAGQAQLADSQDSYIFAEQINTSGQPLLGAGPSRPQRVDSVDTSSFGHQPDLFDPDGSGGGPERTSCGPASNGETSRYGKTAWWDIHPDVNGDVFIQATGFDAVVGAVRYQALDDPSIVEDLGCVDDPGSSSLEEAVLEVRAGFHYSIQIGGFGGYVSQGGDPSLAESGTLEFRLNFFPDSDLDGVYDGGTSPDRCPTQSGPAAHRGCPDSDGDGTPNIDDRCSQRGPTQHGGCPDTDNDGLRDLDRDNCDSVPGPARYEGCPDADGDGVPEGPGASPRDACEDKNPEDVGRRDTKPKDGCPDHIKIKAIASYRYTTRNAPAGGLVLKYFKLRNVPKGAKVSVACKPRGRCRALRIGRTKREGTVSVKSLRGRGLPSGTRIIARVTASNATARYIRVTIIRGSFRCVAGPSLKKLKKCN